MPSSPSRGSGVFRSVAAIAAATLTACAAPPPIIGPLPGVPREVVIDNRTDEPVQVMVAVPGHPLGELPDAVVAPGACVTRSMRPGRYVLWQLFSQRSMPLPVLPWMSAYPGSGGYVVPEPIVVQVRQWPTPCDGFAWIPPGPGLVGDDLGVGQEDERPTSTPHLDGFWLATNETTNAQFVAFLNAHGRDEVDPSWLDLDGSKCRVQWDERAGAFTTDAPRLPVVTVSWPGAVAYCEWLSETLGTRHRLPSEIEWEKAARGPGSRVYAYGDVSTTAAANQESGRLREVGQFPPNGFRLFDMTGNAFEWTATAYARNAYSGAEEPAGHDAFRVLRGGSFVLDGIFCRNSMRMRLRPDVRADDVGFRVLREAPPDSR